MSHGETVHPYDSPANAVDLNDPVFAQALNRLIEQKVDARVAAITPRYDYGVVSAVNTTTLKASVFLVGSASATPGIRYEPQKPPAVNDRVLVVTYGADRYIAAVFTGGGSFPSGAIVLWSGQTSAIPTGWALCDGSNGTPDLRDRFVIGADSTNEGTSGGTTSPSAALGTHATHAGHSAHADHADHKHSLPMRVSGTSLLIVYGDTSGVGATPAGNVGITAGGGTTTQAGSGTELTELTHDAHSAHDAHGAHDLPKFYRLAYIMRL